ncbi:MAG: hypothetical protein U1E65_02370 [Myxococcota bacterium]
MRTLPSTLLASLSFLLGPTPALAYETWEDIDAPQATSSSAHLGRRQTSPYVFSALGQQPQQGTICFGAFAAFAPDFSAGPQAAFDLAYARGLNGLVDFDLRAQSALLSNNFEIGARLHRGDAEGAVALRADLATQLAWSAGDRPTVLGALGVLTGVSLSFGSKQSQFTLNFDAAMYFLAFSEKRAAGGFIANLRPSLAVEVPVTTGATFTARVGADLVPQTQRYLPTLGLGVAW